MIDAYVIKSGDKVFNAAIYARSYKITTVPEKSRNSPDPYMGFVIVPNETTLNMPNGLHLWKQAQEVRAAVVRGEMYAAPPVREAEGAEATTTDRPMRQDGNEPPPRSDDDIPF